MKKAHYRTLWLSDIHLGYKDCKADYLLNLLNHCTFDHLYLVGDIIDMWAMSKRLCWPDSHNQLLHTLLSLPTQGVKVTYLPGNHDAPTQKYSGLSIGNMTIARQARHTCANGKELLILHGDQFDQDVCFGKLHNWVGDKAYSTLLFVNRWVNYTRIKMGRNYWSLSGYIKSRVSGATNAIERYKQAALSFAQRHQADGIVCGHIHHPEISTDKNIHYFNTGDWVENCSALVENSDGSMELIYWAQVKEPLTLYPKAA